MRTEQWIKKLGGHAGELFVAAELSKRGIPNALLPENFSDDDLLAGSKDGTAVCFIQVKACHPDRSRTFILRETDEKWCGAPANQFVVFVWLGSAAKNEPPRYWIALKRDVGQACVDHHSHGTTNWERRFDPEKLPTAWIDDWDAIRACISPDVRSHVRVKRGA